MVYPPPPPPPPLCPSTTILFPQLSLSIFTTYVCSFLCVAFNSSSDFLFLHIHCAIIMSFFSSFAKSSYFTAQVSLPYGTTLLTHAWKILPFVHSENTLKVSRGQSSLNFFQSYLTLATMCSSTPQAVLIVSPK